MTGFGGDIIVEILSRLPVKSLLKFRCVCKDWYQIIESTPFIRKHYNQENNHSRLLVRHYPEGGVYGHFALFPDKDLRGTPPVHEDLYKKLNSGDIFGPVNGLFFLHCDVYDRECLSYPMAIWNPATRQLRPIKYPKPTIPSHCSVNGHEFGFGFDSVSNDYKVVCFRCYWNDETGKEYGNPDFTIYSSSKDSWSSPIGIVHEPMTSLHNTVINGTYYGLSYQMTQSGTCPYHILSFDMASEEIRYLPIPDNLYRCLLGGDSHEELILYNDHLAMLISNYYSPDQYFYHIWKMEEEGCWIELLKIGPCQDCERAKDIWKYNELLILDNNFNRLLLYNIDTSEMKDLGLESYPDYFSTYKYKESLVSIKGGTDDWRLLGSCVKDCK